MRVPELIGGGGCAPPGGRRAALAVLLAVAGACGCGAAPPVVDVARFDSVSGVPPSRFDDVLALGGGRACVPDNYLFKVRCFDREERRWWSFGGQGAGPGEFRSMGPLLRAGGDSLIGVVDWQHARLSIHELDGPFVGGFPLPLLFRPLTDLDERLVGLWATFTEEPEFVARVAMLDGTTGEIVDEVVIREDRGDDDGMGFPRGVALADGTLLLHVAGHRYAHYGASGERLDAFLLPEPLRAPAYPTARDLEDFAEDMRHLFGAPPSASQLEERADKPLHPVVPETTLRAGPRGTAWVAAARDRRKRSTLHVLRPDGHLASVSVRDRLLAFDILGDTLVVLVERPDEDEEGYVRGIDWYRISF